MSVLTVFPAYLAPSVPIVPTVTPASSSIFDRISTVEVLPFVPVTATIFSLSDALSK